MSGWGITQSGTLYISCPGSYSTLYPAVQCLGWCVPLRETIYILWPGSCNTLHPPGHGLWCWTVRDIVHNISRQVQYIISSCAVSWGVVTLADTLYTTWQGSCSTLYPAVFAFGRVSHCQRHCTYDGLLAAAHHIQLYSACGGVSHCQIHCT